MLSLLQQVYGKRAKVKLNPLIEAFSVKDVDGNSRIFDIKQRLDSLGIFLEAEETVDYGYRFAVHGELDCDQKELLNRLIDKVKHGVKTSNLKHSHIPNGQQTEGIAKDQVVGRLDYDESNVTPLIVIDGKPYTWEQLGQMVSSFEGFQIQMKFFDMTDDVE